MSSLSTPESHAPDPLLLLLDPSAREADGESVRIAKDVLCGGADVKVAMPESPAELDRVLSHRGRRRPVVIGCDLAVQRVLQTLHRQRELGGEPVGVVPVGRPAQVATARALGVPAEPVAAARAVINGAPRKLDLLVDDGGGVVFGGLRIGGSGPDAHGRTGGWRSLWAKLAAAEQGKGSGLGEHPGLRVEADGRLLSDAHEPLWLLDAALADGSLDLLLHGGAGRLRVQAASLTVTGQDFGYEADGRPVGPVRERTWRLRSGVWELMLPSG